MKDQPAKVVGIDEGGSLLLRLVEELGNCSDVGAIYRKSAKIFSEVFAPFDVFGVIASDPAEVSWRAMAIENPRVPSWGGLAAHQLEGETDTDSLTLKHGRSLSRKMVEVPELDSLLRQEEEIAVVSREDSPKLLEVFSECCGIELESLIGCWWHRPRGGRGWIFLASRQPRSYEAETQKLFAASVKVAARMAWYPGLVQSILRQEKLNYSMRRHIVHDLKTPLTVVKGCAQTILEHWDSTSDEVKIELLGSVVENSERLLNDLKDLLEPLDAVWTPTLEVFDLSLVLEHIRRQEEFTERSRGHKIHVVGSDAPVMIKADRRKIRRVLENILSNAVKYSPIESEGDVKNIWIKIWEEEGRACVSFKDEGLGMDDVQLHRVLNRAGRAVSAQVGIEGTGLGLDSVRRILDAHQGSLKAQSRPGKGSTFWVCLPKDGPKATTV